MTDSSVFFLFYISSVWLSESLGWTSEILHDAKLFHILVTKGVHISFKIQMIIPKQYTVQGYWIVLRGKLTRRPLERLVTSLLPTWKVV